MIKITGFFVSGATSICPTEHPGNGKENMKNKKKKGYSSYENPNANINNKKPVKEGSVIVANLSDYENIPKNVKDHRRESVAVLKDEEGDLGVVFIHGKNDVSGKSRAKKEEAELWQAIEKNGQAVYIDLDIRVRDAKGNPIKQGKVFQNTGIMIDKENMAKVEKHIYEKGGRKSHSIRNIVSENRRLRDKKKKANK